MEQTRIQMFEQQIYPEIFAEVAGNVMDRFGKQKKEIIEEWKTILQQYMDQIADLQEEEEAPSIQEIDFSFLYTSLEDKHAKFQIDSYGEGGRVSGESILTEYISADWIADGAKVLAERLAERAEQENLRGYVRAAEIDKLRLRAVRSLLLCLAVRFKYIIRDMIDFRSLARVQKEPCFLVQIGEYMDWMKTIYAVQPAVDIFNCEQDTDLRFRSFHAIHYNEKQFKAFNLSQSDFRDCVFTESSITDCLMNDCMFDGCVFERLCIESTMMKGCIFVNCIFQETIMKEIVLSESDKESSILDYFAPAEFHNCEFREVRLENCNADNCIVKNCDASKLGLENSSIVGSGFEERKDKEGQDELF